MNLPGKATHLYTVKGLACGIVHSEALRTNLVKRVNCLRCRRTLVYKNKLRIDRMRTYLI